MPPIVWSVRFARCVSNQQIVSFDNGHSPRGIVAPLSLGSSSRNTDAVTYGSGSGWDSCPSRFREWWWSGCCGNTTQSVVALCHDHRRGQVANGAQKCSDHVWARWCGTRWKATHSGIGLGALPGFGECRHSRSLRGGHARVPGVKYSSILFGRAVNYHQRHLGDD